MKSLFLGLLLTGIFVGCATAEQNLIRGPGSHYYRALKFISKGDTFFAQSASAKASAEYGKAIEQYRKELERNEAFAPAIWGIVCATTMQTLVGDNGNRETPLSILERDILSLSRNKRYTYFIAAIDAAIENRNRVKLSNLMLKSGNRDINKNDYHSGQLKFSTGLRVIEAYAETYTKAIRFKYRSILQLASLNGIKASALSIRHGDEKRGLELARRAVQFANTLNVRYPGDSVALAVLNLAKSILKKQ